MPGTSFIKLNVDAFGFPAGTYLQVDTAHLHVQQALSANLASVVLAPPAGVTPAVYAPVAPKTPLDQQVSSLLADPTTASGAGQRAASDARYPNSAGAIARSVPVRNQKIPCLYFHNEDPTAYILAGLRLGYMFVGINDVAAAIAGKALLPAKAALLFYDDAHLMQYTTIHPIINSFYASDGVRATLAVVPDFIDGLPVDWNLASYLGPAFTATATSGSATLTGVSSFAGLNVGDPVSASDGSVQAGSTITALDSTGGTITLSLTVTSSGTKTLSGKGTPMSWANVNTMVASGAWDVANHTKVHAQLTAQTSAQRLSDLAAANSRIATMTGSTPQAVVYPQGFFDSGVTADAAALGFRLGLATNWGDVPFYSVNDLSGGRYSWGRESTAITLTEAYLDDLVDWEWDVTPYGRNRGNRLGFWSFSGGGGSLLNTGSLQITGGSGNRYAFTVDYLKVRGGDRLAWSFQFGTSGQTAGNAIVQVQQYTGPATARAAGTASNLATLTTTTANARKFGELTLDAATTYVRFQLFCDSAFTGTATLTHPKVARAAL